MSVQRTGAVLQGPRHCERTLGSTLDPQVQGKVRAGGLRGAHREQEEVEDLDSEGRPCFVSLEGERKQVEVADRVGSWLSLPRKPYNE